MLPSLSKRRKYSLDSVLRSMSMFSPKKFKGILHPNCLKSLQKWLRKPLTASLCREDGENLQNYDDYFGTDNKAFTSVHSANGPGIA